MLQPACSASWWPSWAGLNHPRQPLEGGFVLELCTVSSVRRNCVLVGAPNTGSHLLELTPGMRLIGRLTDARCSSWDKTPDLPTPSCPISSFEVLLRGPALLAPAVRPCSNVSGQHAFATTQIWDVGEYELDVVLDLTDDLGFCQCRIKRNDWLRRHLLQTKLQVKHSNTVACAPDTQLWHGDGPSGRWLRTSCSRPHNTGAHTGCHATFIAHACAEGNLLLGQEWLWVPFQSANFEVLPLEFMARKGGPYWLHIEGDSTIMRAEVQELIWLLNGRSTDRVLAQRMKCFDLHDGTNYSHRVACGVPTKPQAVFRHRHNKINVYSWNIEAGGNGRGGGRTAKVFLSISLAGGVQGNTRHTTPPSFYSKWSKKVGRCRFPNASADLLTSSTQRDCSSMPGVGRLYWEKLFNRVGVNYVGKLEPDAIVLQWGFHFNLEMQARGWCSNEHAFADHVEFWIQSLRLVYVGPLAWRRLAVPQWSPKRGWGHAPSNCESSTRVHHYQDMVDPILRRHHVPSLYADAMTAGWANASCDNLHFDGGILRQKPAIPGWDSKRVGPSSVRDQPVTTNLLNVLLNHLRSEARFRRRDLAPRYQRGAMPTRSKEMHSNTDDGLLAWHRVRTIAATP